MRKPRPTADPRFVFHPEQDAGYRHFENHQTAPFATRATAVTRANAWWLADAALLAYWDPGDAIPRFGAAGLAADFIGRGDTQVYVASSADAVLVSFRGSEPDRLGDAFDDASFALTRWTTGAVHQGFERALERVWPEIDAMIAPLANTRAVWFTGHSLGAALATLAADRFPATAGVCTLGSPRVGDRAFAAAFDARFGARALRYVNDSDVVTHVPPPLPLSYAHVGELRQITPEGRVTQQPPALAHFVRDLFGDVGHLQEITNLLSAGTLKRPPHFLLDHMPRGYAVDIWNDFDAHGNA